MNYIPADKLIAEIERRLKIVEPHKDTFESAAACRKELIWMKEFILSLQQEQPEVDLLKALDDYYNKEDFGPSDAIEYETHKDIARHFYELGLNARKEK